MSRFPSVWRICRLVCWPRQNDVPGGQLAEVEENMTGLVRIAKPAGSTPSGRHRAVHGRDARATKPFRTTAESRCFRFTSGGRFG
ncbi:MAG: hypothetical protein DMG08_16155 [Acidobacteria bacterium]|nr:MAG: hypothetical protein DMG08_16155 [Acidobacteriota bacterium]